MDNIEMIQKMLMENQMQETDIFSFKCDGCGKCCYSTSDIVLTPYDLFYMASELKVIVEDVINRYCTRYVGSDSKIPIVAIGSGRCPFLTERGCRLNSARPVICKLYPLGRGVYGEKMVYFTQNISCGESCPNQTVGDWVDLNKITDENRRFTEKWYKLLTQVALYIHKRQFSEHELDAFQTTLIVLLYMCYDMKGQFYTQFLNRAEALEKIMEKI